MRRFEAEALAAGHALHGEMVLAALGGRVIDEMLVAVDRVRTVAATALLTNNLSPMDPTSPIASPSTSTNWRAIFMHFGTKAKTRRI